MGELEKLKKENQQLKVLLKNAVKLLERYKVVLASPKRKAPAKTKRIKK